jgi:hypothetical protein
MVLLPTMRLVPSISGDSSTRRLPVSMTSLPPVAVK